MVSATGGGRVGTGERDDKLPPFRLSMGQSLEVPFRTANELAEWSHAYLAHAGGPESRKRIAELTVTANKITDAIKALARVTEAILAWLLFAGGRSRQPDAGRTIRSIRKAGPADHGATAEADALWQRLSAEHDRYLDGFEDDLI
jgi:hypothetical protein